MREFLTLLKRELKSITKEKTILLAVFVQLVIALLSTAILEGVMSFYDPNFIGWSTSRVNIGFVGDEDTPLLQYIKDSDILTKEYPSLASAEAAFRAGKIDAILSMPETQDSPVTMKLFLPKLEAKKTAVLLILDRPLKNYEDYLREDNGVLVHYKDLDSKPFSPFEFIYTVLIPILMLFPALVAGSMVIDTISEEFENDTLDTLLSTPISLRQVLASKVSAAVIIAVIQIFLWACLLRWNDIIIEKLPLVLILGISYTVTISFGGAIIALLFKDRQRSQFAYSMILILVGAASYFVNPSPIDLLTKLSSGAPDIGYIGLVTFILLPLPVSFVFYRLSKL